MKVKVIDRPRKWDNRSLALATKEELAADIIIRRQFMEQARKKKTPSNIMAVCQQKRWIKIIKKELKSRYVLDGEIEIL